MKKFVIFSLFILFTVAGMNATVWYIKSNGTTANDAGKARDWKTACSDLQAVINISSAGDEIWVAAGTYQPNRKANALNLINKGNPDNAFVLKSDVKIYGGFPSNANDKDNGELNSRNPKTNETVLSGNLGKDKSNGVCHVVIAVAGRGEVLYLDGFTISGGNADGEGFIRVSGQTIERHIGGGIVTSMDENSRITLINNTFTNNYASYGGGLAALTSADGDIGIVNSLFKHNSAEYGGGMYAFIGDANAVITLSGSTVNDNQADYGGGVYVVTLLKGKINIQNNSITDNFANINGGGLSAGVYYGGEILLDNDKLTHNSASEKGGGAFLRAEISSISVRNSILRDNTGNRNVSTILRHDGTLNISGCDIGDPDLPDRTRSSSDNRFIANR